MARNIWAAAILIMFLALAACGPATRSNRASAITVDTVIIYEREGGFAGISQEWVIHPDGTIDGPGEQAMVVPSEDVAELLTYSTDLELESLATGSATPDACCDQFTYTLTLVVGEQEWSMSTTDTATQSPEVSELFSLVEELIASAQPMP